MCVHDLKSGGREVGPCTPPNPILHKELDVLDVHLVKVPPFGCGKHDHGSNGSHLCHWGKGLFIVDTVRLCIAFCYESSLVAVDGAVNIILHLIYPSTTDCLLVR